MRILLILNPHGYILYGSSGVLSHISFTSMTTLFYKALILITWASLKNVNQSVLLTWLKTWPVL